MLLAERGAECTQAEINKLGKVYRDFKVANTLPHSTATDLVSPDITGILQEKDAIIQQQANTLRAKDELILQRDFQIQQLTQILGQYGPQACKKLQLEAKQLKSQLHFQSQQLEKQDAALKWLKKKEEMLLQDWIAQKIKASLISLSDLKDIMKIGCGCDAMVFRCSAVEHGLERVAVKILYNFGVPSKTVKQAKTYNNEFSILKDLPMHINIIPLLKYFLEAPPAQFINQFPEDLTQYVVHSDGRVRTTTCILMPILECFARFFHANFTQLALKAKLSFISDVVDGLWFLFENNILHRDFKLDNLLIRIHPGDLWGRVIISDFGYAIQVSPNKTVYLSPSDAVGGAICSLAPEVRSINTSIYASATLVDYSKQPSFELGVVAHEIFYGIAPDTFKFGESMDQHYFSALIAKQKLDDAHRIPELEDWIRGLLMEDKNNRTSFEECIATFSSIMHKTF